MGDHTRLQQVLVNLIKILVKMCKGKPISILAAFDEDQSELQVQLIDEGNEIDAATLKSLHYYLENDKEYATNGDDRGDNSDSYRRLFICKQIVQLNAGQIFIYSNAENRGITFQFSMSMRFDNNGSQAALKSSLK